jgi:hypothetical protein
MLAQKKMPDGQKEEISQVGILLNQEEKMLIYCLSVCYDVSLIY